MFSTRRIAVQEMDCDCLNECERGNRTPYPLTHSSPDNILGEYCLGCPKLSYLNLQLFSYEENINSLTAKK